MKSKRTERGWAGHFICGHRCLFRRNTLIEHNNIKIVVSTVGRLMMHEKIEPVGCDRHYETMAFHSDSDDNKYHDADVGREVIFDSNWMLSHEMADNEANMMHEDVVKEICTGLEAGNEY